MIEFAKRPVREMAAFFEESAANRNVARIIVEKDFWVCYILMHLFGTPQLKDHLVFKGGTSLSKVFGIIKRFSEDIDLSIDPAWIPSTKVTTTSAGSPLPTPSTTTSSSTVPMPFEESHS